jgi:hypothetical protein
MENDKLTQTDSKQELLIGCGKNHSKKIAFRSSPDWANLTTMDINPEHKPDIVWDLNKLPLPIADNSIDEIHAYEVLEHLGTQGDYKFFFAQFSDFWRILKPKGLIVGSCPTRDSVWAFGDPSHTRIIQKENFVFLSQYQYTAQVGKSPMTDFRYIYKADFQVEATEEVDGLLKFVLRAIKPSRIRV